MLCICTYKYEGKKAYPSFVDVLHFTSVWEHIVLMTALSVT